MFSTEAGDYERLTCFLTKDRRTSFCLWGPGSPPHCQFPQHPTDTRRWCEVEEGGFCSVGGVCCQGPEAQWWLGSVGPTWMSSGLRAARATAWLHYSGMLWVCVQSWSSPLPGLVSTVSLQKTQGDVPLFYERSNYERSKVLLIYLVVQHHEDLHKGSALEQQICSSLAPRWLIGLANMHAAPQTPGLLWLLHHGSILNTWSCLEMSS